MQISRLCKIDSDDEEYFDSLWLPKIFIGCDKAAACNVFKLCTSLHAGMQNFLLAIGVLAVMLGVFWILHTCINELGQTEYCSICGYYDPNLINDSDNDSEHRNGRKRRRRENQCGNCVKRRRATDEPSCHMRPDRRCNSYMPARVHTSYVGHGCIDPPIRLWVHANKVHIRPVEDMFPANNNVQPGEEEVIPPHRRSRSRSPEASCSRVSMGSPNLYVVEDTPPRPSRSDRGSCRPPVVFNLRSAWDSSSDEEEEGQVPVRT